MFNIMKYRKSTGPHVDIMIRIDGVNNPFWANRDYTIDPSEYFIYKRR